MAFPSSSRVGTSSSSSSSFTGSPPVLGRSSITLEVGLPTNPLVAEGRDGALDEGAESGASVVEEEAKEQVLSYWQEAFRDSKSLGERMLVRVTMLEITSSLLLMRVVEARKKVVK